MLSPRDAPLRAPRPVAPPPAPPSDPILLQGVRAAIDSVDARLVQLLAQRTRLSRQAALAKALAHVAHKSPAREAEVRARYRAALGRHGWSEAQADALASTLIDLAGDAPDVRVAIQGGPGSWSEETLHEVLPGARPVRSYTVPDAWRRVREGHAVAAWLPRANTVVGPIRESVGPLAEGDAWAEATFPIRHALLALPGLAIEDVARVEAHPYALAQCARSLDRLVPRAERTPTVDGAHSAWTLRPERRTAVVASASLAGRAGLSILAPDVADDAANATTFTLVVPR